MLENVKYNLGRDYNFYGTILLVQRSKEGAAVAIRKYTVHKRLNIRKTLQVVPLEVYLIGRPPDMSTTNRSNQVIEENMRYLLG